MFNLMATLDFNAVGKENIDENGSFTGVLAASHLNYLVINNVALFAKYQELSSDMAVHELKPFRNFSRHFPAKQL